MENAARMRFACALVIVLGLAAGAWLTGCGVKSAPIPPELAKPERILNLHAMPALDGIKIGWGRPTTYANGHAMRDLGSFVILRAEGDGPMAPLVELPLTDQARFQVAHTFTYDDRETVLNHRYRYAIVSKTTDNYVSDPSNEVDFTRVNPPPPPNPANLLMQRPSPLATPLP